VTAAKPGNLNVLDISNTQTPKILQAISTAPGTHYLLLSPDERYAYVQNSVLNLPCMSDSSYTMVDLVKGEAVGKYRYIKESRI
jgi:hypothetical protein